MNALLLIKSSILKGIESASKESIKSIIKDLSEIYKFDYEEALSRVNLTASVEEEGKERLKGNERLKKEKKSKKEKEILLPFNGKCDDSKCIALKKNEGLYTQCENNVEIKGDYCGECMPEGAKYGTISDRMKVGLYEYVDPLGEKPISYLKFLKKNKVTVEEAVSAAILKEIEINEEHIREKKKEKKLEKVSEVKKAKGRPKKSEKVIELQSPEEDLFAALTSAVVADAESKSGHLTVVPVSASAESEANVSPKSSSNEAEKEAEKLKKAEEKAEKLKKVEEKAEKEAEKLKKADDKAAKEAEKLKKADDKAAKEAEKLKKAEEKAAKEAEKLKKAEEKAAKEAEKLKKAEEKAAKEAEKQKKAEKKAAKENNKKVDPKPVVPQEKDVDEESVASNEEPEVEVDSFTFKGVKYFKSSVGVIYDANSQEIGRWNEKNQCIDFEELEEEEEDD
jgi:hypothetical protein